MQRASCPAASIIAASFGASSAALGSLAIAAQDRDTVRVPGGLSLGDFKGYEAWDSVAVSQTDAGLKVMTANSAMIAAYKSGVPGRGKAFPDGSTIAKIEWTVKKNTESPSAPMNELH